MSVYTKRIDELPYEGDVTICCNCQAETEHLADLLDEVATDPQEMTGYWCPACGTVQARLHGKRIWFVPVVSVGGKIPKAEPLGVTADEAAATLAEASRLTRGAVFSAIDDTID